MLFWVGARGKNTFSLSPGWNSIKLGRVIPRGLEPKLFIWALWPQGVPGVGSPGEKKSSCLDPTAVE